MSTQTIFVKSHVSRDLLQNAALFKTDKLVVWEYVSNGLQYIDSGTNPVVMVILDSKNRRIVVSDNGRGMDWEGLQNFFIMHGENIDRQSGRPGRGRFGTGKSAAFGVADVLRVRTARNGMRSSVELRRDDLENAASGDPIPVRVVEKEVRCQSDNGTTIEIEQIHLRSLDQAGIIRYIERHLARWPKNCSVLVNNHECEYSEPFVAELHKFSPSGAFQTRLGDVQLTVKVAKAPVDDDLRGISIFSNGIWHETTLAGAEGKEMSNCIFGDLDVPSLEHDSSPIPPFDLSRSMKLNPNNPLVRMIYAFIFQSVEQVRHQLVAKERERRATEEARKLASQAEEISRFINQDFDAFKNKLKKVRAKSRGSVDKFDTRLQETDGSDLIFGGEIPSMALDGPPSRGSTGGSASTGHSPQTSAPEVTAAEDGRLRGRTAASAALTSQRRGGFRVEFKALGDEERRATYLSEERTIYINIDHPQLKAARGTGNTDDITFKRLSYEIAFTEYAIALSSELALRGEYLDPSDPIFEIRETVNRLARRGAHLYMRPE